MSSMSSVAGLSKFITTLPKTKYSILVMLIISILTGIIYFLVDSVNYSFIEEIIYGGLYTLMILGIPSIMSGALNQQVVSIWDGINLKIKHSMFLSALSMTILSLILIVGSVISRIFNIDIFLNSLLFGCVIIYGFNTLVFWATSKIRFTKAVTTALIQPILIISMYILITFLVTDTRSFGFAKPIHCTHE